jgi:ribosome-associated translation inhibitor RaiA
MNVQISIRHMVASKVIKQMVNDLCHEVKNKYEYIQNIDVKIEDMNGPYKTGIDKRCHLKVRGNDHLAIDINDIDEDITHAIDRAFHHLKKTLKNYSYNKFKHPGNYDVGSCYLIEV